MTKAEFLEKYSGKHYGDVKSLENKLADLASLVFENASENALTVAVDTTLTADDMGRTINVATDAKTVTLPLITPDILGKKLRFRNTGADGAVLLKIAPNALDGINGTVPNGAGDSVASGVVNKYFGNTKATANNGDWVELEAVAATKWFITGGVGIWASEG